jgi:hypothetical protein
MTEAEWLACEDPQPMLGHLKGKASDRKLRLFACACCRRIWHLLKDKRSRWAVEMEERFADGSVERAILMAAGKAAWAVWTTPAGAATRDVGAVEAAQAAQDAARHAAWAITSLPRVHEMKAQAALLRDIVGFLPFRPTPLDPIWLSWNDGTVAKLAQAIYEERAFDHLPILADALEDAGCTDQDILGHCRGPGPHLLGCWVVDLLLGKE